MSRENPVATVIKKVGDVIARMKKSLGVKWKDEFATLDELLEVAQKKSVEEEAADSRPMRHAGFSKVTQEDLDKLGVTQGSPIKFSDDLTKLAHARTQKISSRFRETDRYFHAAGCSEMESLRRILVCNYLFESLFHPSRKTKGRKPKLAPELHIGPTMVDSALIRLELNGFIDFVTFHVGKSENPSGADMQSWEHASQIVGPTACNVEVKRTANNLSGDHIREGVAQALAAYEESGKDQRFVLTDGSTWRFCLLRNRIFHLSYAIDVLEWGKDGHGAVLTALDDWIWADLAFSVDDEAEDRPVIWTVQGS